MSGSVEDWAKSRGVAIEPRVEGDPVDFVVPDDWSKGEKLKWQNQTVATIELIARSRHSFTSHLIWHMTPNPPGGDRRCMLAAINRSIKGHIIERTGEMVKAPRVYETLDGHKFQLNKVVPVYRSLLLS